MVSALPGGRTFLEKEPPMLPAEGVSIRRDFVRDRQTGSRLTSGVVVADGVPDTHGRVHGPGLTEVNGAAQLFGVDPNQLRKVAPDGEVAHVGLLTVERGQVGVELAIVPHVGGGLGNGRGLTKVVAVSGTPHGEVLAVAAATGGAARPLVLNGGRTLV